TALMRTAEMSVISSGNDVAAARKMEPTQTRPRFVRAAITSLLRASATPAATTAAALAASAATVLRIGSIAVASLRNRRTTPARGIDRAAEGRHKHNRRAPEIGRAHV